MAIAVMLMRIKRTILPPVSGKLSAARHRPRERVPLINDDDEIEATDRRQLGRADMVPLLSAEFRAV
jgi:hypothetical protein